jgi:hypothetical protein
MSFSRLFFLILLGNLSFVSSSFANPFGKLPPDIKKRILVQEQNPHDNVCIMGVCQDWKKILKDYRGYAVEDKIYLVLDRIEALAPQITDETDVYHQSELRSEFELLISKINHKLLDPSISELDRGILFHRIKPIVISAFDQVMNTDPLLSFSHSRVIDEAFLQRHYDKLISQLGVLPWPWYIIQKILESPNCPEQIIQDSFNRSKNPNNLPAVKLNIYWGLSVQKKTDPTILSSIFNDDGFWESDDLSTPLQILTHLISHPRIDTGLKSLAISKFLDFLDQPQKLGISYLPTIASHPELSTQQILKVLRLIESASSIEKAAVLSKLLKKSELSIREFQKTLIQEAQKTLNKLAKKKDLEIKLSTSPYSILAVSELIASVSDTDQATKLMTDFLDACPSTDVALMYLLPIMAEIPRNSPMWKHTWDWLHNQNRISQVSKKYLLLDFYYNLFLGTDPTSYVEPILNEVKTWSDQPERRVILHMIASHPSIGPDTNILLNKLIEDTAYPEAKKIILLRLTEKIPYTSDNPTNLGDLKMLLTPEEYDQLSNISYY